MKEIAALGDDLERAYRAAEYDERVFPELATRALETHAPHRSFRVAELVRWMHEASQVPNQPDSSFGEPPVTLYCGSRFYIEALFWLDGTPSIHQHSFSGAFQVLEGGSLHARYRFVPERVISQALRLGALQPSAPPELLRKGDTRPIPAGDALIHSTFHLDCPSVTLVARTHHDPGSPPQFRYLRPGIALHGFHYDARLPRLLQLVESVFRARLPDRLPIAARFLETADLYASILVLERLVFAARDELMQLVALVGRRHPDAAGLVRAAIEELRRQRLITARRASVRGPQHRFLLALLLNLEERDEILRLVAAEAPGRDPIEQIVAWVAELSHAGGGERDDADPLGYRLGEVELQVLRLLLQRRPVDEILARLAAEYDGVAQQEATVRALCASLRGSALFRRLLAEP